MDEHREKPFMFGFIAISQRHHIAMQFTVSFVSTADFELLIFSRDFLYAKQDPRTP